jgi:hypothetical protein
LKGALRNNNINEKWDLEFSSSKVEGLDDKYITIM